jgi:hypothetical protein
MGNASNKKKRSTDTPFQIKQGWEMTVNSKRFKRLTRKQKRMSKRIYFTLVGLGVSVAIALAILGYLYSKETQKTLYTTEQIDKDKNEYTESQFRFRDTPSYDVVSDTELVDPEDPEYFDSAPNREWTDARTSKPSEVWLNAHKNANRQHRARAVTQAIRHRLDDFPELSPLFDDSESESLKTREDSGELSRIWFDAQNESSEDESSEDEN